MRIAFIKGLIVLLLALVSFRTVHANWQRDASHPGQDITDVEVVDSWLYFSSADTVYRRSDAANLTVRMGAVGDGITISRIFNTGSKLIVGTYNNGIYESLDEGVSWKQRNSGLTGVGSHSITAIASRGDSLYIGTSGAGVFVSSLNSELNWQSFNNGLPWNSAWEIYALHNWKDLLFTGAGLSGYVYRNHRDSSNWSYIQFNVNIGTGLAMFDICMIDENILVGLASNGIYYSHDNGTNWKFHATPFSAASKGKVLSVFGRTFAIFSHVSMGIYIYEWTANEWVLNDHQVGLVAYDFDYFNGGIYAACWDGLWIYPLHTTGVDPQEPTLPKTPQLSQNCPNPFNPVTTFQYSLPERSHVTLEVYNVLGQRVKTLVDYEELAGSYSITWNSLDNTGTPAATGIYFYRLQAGDYVETKKMLLLR